MEFPFELSLGSDWQFVKKSNILRNVQPSFFREDTIEKFLAFESFEVHC